MRYDQIQIEVKQNSYADQLRKSFGAAFSVLEVYTNEAFPNASSLGHKWTRKNSFQNLQ